MDKLQENVNKASHVLLEAEVRLRTIYVQLQQLEKEIAMLTSVEANLEENIRVLKRRRVIVVAREFRKAQADLGTARNRRAFLRMDRENVLKIEKIAQDMYNKASADYKMAYDRLHNPIDNVIRVEFGRKDGQQG